MGTQDADWEEEDGRLQDDERAQASGAFCEVVRIESIHVPGDQRQFTVIFFWGFGCGSRTGFSQVYTAELTTVTSFIMDQRCHT